MERITVLIPGMGRNSSKSGAMRFMLMIMPSMGRETILREASHREYGDSLLTSIMVSA